MHSVPMGAESFSLLSCQCTSQESSQLHSPSKQESCETTDGMSQPPSDWRKYTGIQLQVDFLKG